LRGGGTSGATIMLAAPFTTNAIAFNPAGCLLSGSTITLTGATAPTITINATSGTITSVLVGAAGFTTAVALALSANSSYTGGTTISGEELQIGASGGSVAGDFASPVITGFHGTGVEHVGQRIEPIVVGHPLPQPKLQKSCKISLIRCRNWSTPMIGLRRRYLALQFTIKTPL